MITSTDVTPSAIADAINPNGLKKVTIEALELVDIKQKNYY